MLDGHVADRLIVSARTSGDVESRDGITLFLLDPKANGVTITRTSTVDSRNAAVVELRDVQRVCRGCAGHGRSGRGRSSKRCSMPAVQCWPPNCWALPRNPSSARSGYLRERDQFGVKIGTFQALQHRAAHLFCEIELLRSVVLRALQALDGQEKNAATLVCLAKASAGEVARLATNEAVQMHGGIGMTDEFDIGFFMKRARAAGETFGDAYYHTDRFAQLAGY